MCTHYLREGYALEERWKMKSGDTYHDRNEDRYRINTVDPATVLSYIQDSNYGDHNLVVYPCLGQFEELYTECCKYSTLNRNEIFVVFTYYQHVSAVRKKMHLAGIDTERFENDGRLVIFDSQIAYQTTLEEGSTYNISSLIRGLTNQVQESHREGITLLSDPGAFILNNRIADLVSYEVLFLRNLLDVKVKAFCCYHKDDFCILQEEQRKRIFAHHSTNLFVA
jgi:hypothetical protein